MKRNKDIYEESLPVFPSQRRILFEELTHTTTACDNRYDDEDMTEWYREMKEEQFNRQMEDFFDNYNQI